eukprot:scaffold11393_cov176-Isochrysis_galbana.AAC.1
MGAEKAQTRGHSCAQPTIAKLSSHEKEAQTGWACAWRLALAPCQEARHHPMRSRQRWKS